MTLHGKRNVLPSALATVVLAAVVLPAQAASAASLPVINVHESDHGFTVEGALSRQAGRVTFHFTTSLNASDDGSEVDLAMLRPGKTIADLTKAIVDEGSQTPATAARGTQEIVAATRAFGGAGLNSAPDDSASVTETLYAGTYYLIDIDAAISGQTPQATPIHVHGRPTPNNWPGTSATIVMGKGSTDRFYTPTVLPASQNYLIRNDSDTIHFVAFVPLVTGTTDATIQKILTSNSNSAPTQITGPGVSAGLVSPGGQEVFSSSALKPGTYALLCFVADDQTGMPHAVMGMHTVVQIR
jgi:hypothetical protein